MEIFSLVVGIALLALAIVAMICVSDAADESRIRARWLRFYEYRILISAPLTVLAVAVHGNGGDDAHAYTWYGIPFRYAALGQDGRDYVSLLTPIFFCLRRVHRLSCPRDCHLVVRRHSSRERLCG